MSGDDHGHTGEARPVHWTGTALVNLHGGDARAVLRATTDLHQITCDTCLHLLATDPDTIAEWNEGAS